MRNIRRFLMVSITMVMLTACSKKDTTISTNQNSTSSEQTTTSNAEPEKEIKEIDYKSLDFSSLPERNSNECMANVWSNDRYALLEYAIPGMESSENFVAVYS